MTWNKSVDSTALPHWKLAFDLLRGANEIRFIGYSLPLGDAYIRYLLKAALLANDRLAKIDVLTLDPEGHARQRYADTIEFPFFRSVHGETYQYLASVSNGNVVWANAADTNTRASSNWHESALSAAAK